MPESSFAQIDLTKELRLRRWARLNYVVPEQRSDSWHPIVLEEMSLKDAELAQQAYSEMLTAQAYVPLPPTCSHHHLHGQHEQLAGPNIETQAIQTEAFQPLQS